jgi:hypothetical protein
MDHSIISNHDDKFGLSHVRDPTKMYIPIYLD